MRVLYFKGDTHCVTNRAGHTQRAGNGKRKETVGWSARESEHGTHFFVFSSSPPSLSLSPSSCSSPSARASPWHPATALAHPPPAGSSPCPAGAWNRACHRNEQNAFCCAAPFSFPFSRLSLPLSHSSVRAAAAEGGDPKPEEPKGDGTFYNDERAVSAKRGRGERERVSHLGRKKKKRTSAWLGAALPFPLFLHGTCLGQRRHSRCPSLTHTHFVSFSPSLLLSLTLFLFLVTSIYK